MESRKLTLVQLVKSGCCYEIVTEFAEKFGAEVEVTIAKCIQQAKIWDFDSAADLLLTRKEEMHFHHMCNAAEKANSHWKPAFTAEAFARAYLNEPMPEKWQATA